MVASWDALLKARAGGAAEPATTAPLGATLQTAQEQPSTPYTTPQLGFDFAPVEDAGDAQETGVTFSQPAVPAADMGLPHFAAALQQGMSPQEAAKARELYEQTGIDTTGLPGATKALDAKVKVANGADALAQAPAVSRWMSDQSNAAIAADLVDESAGLEAAWNNAFRLEARLSPEAKRKIVAPPFSFGRLAEDISDIPTAVAAGAENVEANSLSTRELFSEVGMGDNLPAADKARLDHIDRMRQPEAQTTIGGYAQMAAAQIPVMANLFLEGGEDAIVGGAIGGVGGLFVGGPPGAATGVRFGAQIGGKVGMTREAFVQLTGETRRALLQDRDLANNPLDRDLVNKASLVAGALAAGAEVLGGYTVGKLMVDSVRQALVKRLATKTTRDVLAEALKGQFVSALLEGGTEGLQEAIQIATTHIAREMQGGDWAEITWDSIGERLLDAVIAGSVVSVGMTTGPQAFSVARETRLAAEARAARDNVVQVIQFHRDSELRGRSPSAAADLLNTLNQDAEPILIEAQGLSAELSSQGINPVEFFESVGVTPEALDTALRTGQDLEVNAATLVDAIADSNVIEVVADNIRTEPSAPTTAEVALRVDAVKARLAEAAEQYASEPTPESIEFADNIAQQLVATGRETERDAATMSSVIEAFYRVAQDAADKEGKGFSVEQFFNNLGLTIRTPEQLAQEELEAAELGQVIEQQLDPLNQSQEWREAEVTMPMETGDMATLPAGIAFDSIRTRLDAAEQLLRCVRGS